MENQDTLQMIQQAETEGIAAWSEEKKKDFVRVFHDRSKVSQFILITCAAEIERVAASRRFISTKHVKEMKRTGRDADVYHLYDKSSGCYASNVGGRRVSELTELATERAKAILAELPPLKDAVRVIDKSTADKIEKRDVLLKKAKDLKTKLEDLSGSFDLREVDQSMTIGDFRQLVKDREKQRRALALRLNEVGEEGTELDKEINKALYEGLPGLSDAVVSTIQQHLERAVGLSEVSRRVEERVLFGDSKAALELLKSFEADELKIDAGIRADFHKALEKLKLSGRQKRPTSTRSLGK